MVKDQSPQDPTSFDAESKSATIPNSLYSGGRGGGVHHQLLILSPNLLKSQIPYMVVGGGGGGEGLPPSFNVWAQIS